MNNLETRIADALLHIRPRHKNAHPQALIQWRKDCEAIASILYQDTKERSKFLTACSAV